jgi:hypothetical protein
MEFWLTMIRVKTATTTSSHGLVIQHVVGSREVFGRQGASHMDVRKGTGGRGIGRKRFGGVRFSFIWGIRAGWGFGGTIRTRGVFLLRLAAGLREASAHGFFIAVTWEPGGLDIIIDENPVSTGDGRERKTESNCVPF